MTINHLHNDTVGPSTDTYQPWNIDPAGPGIYSYDKGSVWVLHKHIVEAPKNSARLIKRPKEDK